MTTYEAPPSSQATIRKQILDTATEYVCKDRQAAHGLPEDTFQTHAELWKAYLKGRFGLSVCLQSEDVAAMMVLFKMGRVAANPSNMENWIDSAGYSACGGELSQQSKVVEK